ncbi:CHAT domain-containing protein [Anaerolineales bacterium HSG25]|nr:CHAT domain-containing protein [Anaerolineales bacterium HSG25]
MSIEVPKVFISYSHDSLAHEEKVLAFSEQLRADGIDTEIDLYSPWPEEGWPRWMARQVREADFVLLVCTAIYYRRVSGDEEPGSGRGVAWEANLIYNELYKGKTEIGKYLPILFAEGQETHIPAPLQGHSFFHPDSPEGYEALYRRLTNQPQAVPGRIGELKKLQQLRPRAAQAQHNLGLETLAPQADDTESKNFFSSYPHGDPAKENTARFLYSNNTMTTYQPIEIHILGNNTSDSYEIQLSVPHKRDDFPKHPLQIDRQALLIADVDPQKYGQLLGEYLFTGETKGDYREVIAVAQASAKGIRVRLRIDPPHLHDLRWETLRHPMQGTWQSVALTADTPLSRYILAQDWTPLTAVTERPIKALVVIASPDDDSLTPIPEAEIQQVHDLFDSLEGIEPTYLQTDSDALPTLEEIDKHLAQGYHIVHFVCHGLKTKKFNVLCLEDEFGFLKRVPTQRLISSLRAPKKKPLFCFLTACESGGRTNKEAMIPMGQELVSQGRIPAVLAMRDKISMKTAGMFMPQFYRQLLSHGQVDVAVSEARVLVQDRHDWHVPVLFSRLPDNQLLVVEDKTETDDQISLTSSQRKTRGLSGDLFADIKEALLACDEIYKMGELRSLFQIEKLRPWRFRLSVSDTPDGQAGLLIKDLLNQRNTDGENALVLFLQVLRDQRPDTELYGVLDTLAKQLESQQQQ